MNAPASGHKMLHERHGSVLPAILATLLLVPGCSTIAPPAKPLPLASGAPLRVERFALPGPLAGVVAWVDLRHPGVGVEVALTDPTDPDGDGPCAGQLDTPTSAARRNDYALTLNASFFEAPKAREMLGSRVRYYVGNCTWPAGWHVRRGTVVSRPARENLRASLLIHEDGRVSIEEKLMAVPAGVRDVVSGNAVVLKDGVALQSDANAVRHPRSAVGLNADRSQIILVAVDGRQATDLEAPTGQAHSRGATLGELGELMRRFGAHSAINLDGGGSTAMVLKDPVTGTFAVANRPSERSNLKHPVAMERPVADVIGVRIDWNARSETSR